jgi:hypothetical protein
MVPVSDVLVVDDVGDYALMREGLAKHTEKGGLKLGGPGVEHTPLVAGEGLHRADMTFGRAVRAEPVVVAALLLAGLTIKAELLKAAHGGRHQAARVYGGFGGLDLDLVVQISVLLGNAGSRTGLHLATNRIRNASNAAHQFPATMLTVHDCPIGLDPSLLGPQVAPSCFPPASLP